MRAIDYGSEPARADRARQLHNLINQRVAHASDLDLRVLERITRALEVKRLGGDMTEDPIASALRDIEATLAAEDAEEIARHGAERDEAVP
jgi:hypothetical protein